MDYILNDYMNLEIRKSKLFIETAATQFVFSMQEAVLYGEDPVVTESVITEAGESFGAKVKAFFAKIIEAIRNFFKKIGEKIRSIFTKKQSDDIDKMVESSPEIAEATIEVIDEEYINKVAAQRKLLYKALMKKYKAGKLTKEDLDETVAKYDKLSQMFRAPKKKKVKAKEAAKKKKKPAEMEADQNALLKEAEADVQELRQVAEKRVAELEKAAATTVNDTVAQSSGTNPSSLVINNYTGTTSTTASDKEKAVSDAVNKEIAIQTQLASLISKVNTEEAQARLMISKMTYDELKALYSANSANVIDDYMHNRDIEDTYSSKKNIFGKTKTTMNRNINTTDNQKLSRMITDEITLRSTATDDYNLRSKMLSARDSTREKEIARLTGAQKKAAKRR